jgi:cyclic lactone autoinducer peptide
MMKKNMLKQMVRKFGKDTAERTVGKSTPTFVYEPKMPEALKREGK